MSGGIEEFTDLMPHTVTVEPYAGRDAYGKPTYGGAVEYRARVVGRMRMIRTGVADVKVSSVQAYVANSTGITVNDRITLPGEFAPTQPPIMAVGKVPDEAGLHHEVVFA